jgi:cyclopropane-fatty-acyl-phospholipid synthase
MRMSPGSTSQGDGRVSLTFRILSELVRDQAALRVNFHLWNGSLWPDDAPRQATLVLKHPGALRAIFLPGTELGMGEAYLYDDFDIEGDVEQVLALADALSQAKLGVLTRLHLGRELVSLPKGEGKRHRSSRHGPARLAGRPHSLARDRQAVTYHYDVSNDFYALWLDRRLVYSCAYFLSPGDDLDTAQEQKLEHLCRKLRLRPGQRLLDIGCGWGGLVMYAAQRYGVDATGITLSQPQADLAQERIRAAGLSGRCRVVVRDYREMDELESFDALVSVGMFEHVGAAMLPTYFARAYRLLKPRGVFLNHGIACRTADAGPQGGASFGQAYVFPDGELEPINVPLRAAEDSRFEVRDVESLREHYALTLRQWVRRLEAHHTEALAWVDEPTYRTWRLFMAASAYGFSSGRLNVYQTLLAKPDPGGGSALPLTRADWYRSTKAG